MSFIFIDGFDGYDQNDNDVATKLAEHWQTVSNFGNGFQVKTGRYTGKGIQFNSNGSDAELRTLDCWPAVNTDKVIIGFNFLTSSVNTTAVDFEIFSDDADEGVLVLGSTALELKNAGGVEINYPYTANEWHNLEIIVTRNSLTECRIELYVDDVYIYSVATSYTKNQDYCAFICDAATVSTLTIDDFYILDSNGASNNDRVGADIRVETLFPSGTYNDVENWNVAGAADAEDAVDNVPFNPAEYISTPDPNIVQQFLFDDLTNIIGPLASQLRSVSKGDNGVTFKHVVTDVTVETFTLTEDYEERQTIFDQGDLNVSQINSLRAGVSS